MLNLYEKAYNNLRIISTPGTLIKSHPKSFTKTYRVNSDVGKLLDGENAGILIGYNIKYCVVIQTIVVNDCWLMSEVIWLDDYLESEAHE